MIVLYQILLIYIIIVILLGGRVATSVVAISAAEEKKAWLILAWVSTVAMNLSLLGLVAYLIVCGCKIRNAKEFIPSFCFKNPRTHVYEH